MHQQLFIGKLAGFVCSNAEDAPVHKGRGVIFDVTEGCVSGNGVEESLTEILQGL